MNTNKHESAWWQRHQMHQNRPVFIRVNSCPFVVQLHESG